MNKNRSLSTNNFIGFQSLFPAYLTPNTFDQPHKHCFSTNMINSLTNFYNNQSKTNLNNELINPCNFNNTQQNKLLVKGPININISINPYNSHLSPQFYPRSKQFKDFKKFNPTPNVDFSASTFSNSSSQKTSVDSHTFSKDPSFKNDIAEFLKYVNLLLFPIDEVLCTQKGARETLKILVKLHPQCKTVLLNLVSKSLTKIMSDTYGNYFIQKILEKVDQHQVHLILTSIKKDFIKISKNFSGTHAMQALINKITSSEDENIVISAVTGHELEIGVDQSASHVLQAVLAKISEVNREPINNSIIKNSLALALDTNGTCVLKRFIEYCFNIQNKKKLAQIFSDNCLKIAQNAYGNYCMQHMLTYFKIDLCQEIAAKIIENSLNLSLQKYSSNVVEKVIEIADEITRGKMFKTIFNKESSIILLKNKFGRYVIQKCFMFMNAEVKDNIVKEINFLIESIDLPMKEKIKIQKNLQKII